MTRIRELVQKYAQFIRFCIAGGFAFSVNLTVLYILTDVFHIYYLVSTVGAFLVAFSISFLLQKLWTFKDSSRDRLHIQLPLYLGMQVISITLNASLMCTSLWSICSSGTCSPKPSSHPCLPSLFSSSTERISSRGRRWSRAFENLSGAYRAPVLRTIRPVVRFALSCSMTVWKGLLFAAVFVFIAFAILNPNPFRQQSRYHFRRELFSDERALRYRTHDASGLGFSGFRHVLRGPQTYVDTAVLVPVVGAVLALSDFSIVAAKIWVA